MTDDLKITILSFACCNPNLAVHDKDYALRLKEALDEIGAKGQIDLVHVTDALMSMKYAFMNPIVPLFKKYGAAVTPALFVNEKLVLYGGVPTKERLVEVLKQSLEESEMTERCQSK